MKNFISSTEEIILEAKAGKLFILVDDESRENEGDVVIAADFVTPEAINFMITHCRGLVCVPITKAHARQLSLKLMSNENNSAFSTPFTVSVEARTGVSTGVSTADRAHTIKVLTNPNASKDDIVSPGHIFPLVARDGGVLVRTGHTEGSTDICSLAGLNPAAVICEVINDDGTMARMPDLIKFSQEHSLKIGTIADIIEYRRKNERLLEKLSEKNMPDGTLLITYKEKHEDLQHFVVIKGNIKKAPVRLQSFNLMEELGNSTNNFEIINKLKAKYEDLIIIIIGGGSSWQPNERNIRQYGKGAEILKDLGITEVHLLTQTKGRSFAALEGFGVKIVEEILI
jgi:3,4-dihydroxy 2-butanone 4-phosphate synthase/GTP cyclohydrolase II